MVSQDEEKGAQVKHGLGTLGLGQASVPAVVVEQVVEH